MWGIVFTLIYVLLVVGVVVVVLLEGNDMYRTFSWLLIVTFLPVVGVILYLLFGRAVSLNGKKASRFLARINRQTSQYSDEELHRSVLEHEAYGGLAQLLCRSDQRMVLGADSLVVMTDGEQKFRKLFADIEEARHEIHLMYYIIARDQLGRQLRDLLVQKASEGVRVRVLFDGLGSWTSSLRGFWTPLRQAGGEVRAFLPIRFPLVDLQVNHRNHRKVVVIDRHIGYMGGMNIAKRYTEGDALGRWRDTHIRIEGRAVAGLQRIFMTDWAMTLGRQYDVSSFFEHIGAGSESSTERQIPMQFLTNSMQTKWQTIEQAMIKACSIAQTEILIQTPYFIPTHGLLMALCSASLRGVDVQIMLPARGDSTLAQRASDSFISTLLEADIKVYRYSGGFLHSKLLVIDRIVSGVGSANMDFRSLEINMEVMAFVYDRSVGRLLGEAFERDLHECRPLDMEGWGRRSWLRRFMEPILRLMSPLL